MPKQQIVWAAFLTAVVGLGMVLLGCLSSCWWGWSALMGGCQNFGGKKQRHEAEGRCPEAAFKAPQAEAGLWLFQGKKRLVLFLLLTPTCAQKRGSLIQWETPLQLPSKYPHFNRALAWLTTSYTNLFMAQLKTAQTCHVELEFLLVLIVNQLGTTFWIIAVFFLQVRKVCLAFFFFSCRLIALPLFHFWLLLAWMFLIYSHAKKKYYFLSSLKNPNSYLITETWHADQFSIKATYALPGKYI